MKKLALAFLVVALAAIVAVGVSAALGPDSTGTIHACVKNSSGAIRVIASAGGCANSESAVDWTQTSALEVFNDQGFSGTGGKLEITAVEPAPFQHVLTLALSPGGYVVTMTVEAEKTSGDGILVCRSGVTPPPSPFPTYAASRVRVALGTDAGDVRDVTLAGTGSAPLSASGQVEIVCRQRSGATGSNPLIVAAELTAVRVGPITSGSGS